MDKDQILIVTNMDDPHADEVIVALERMGEEPVRLNTDDIPVNTSISLSWADETEFGGSVQVLTNGRTIDPSAVRSVWWRRPSYYGLAPGLSAQEREFVTGELDHTLRSLWASMDDCYWMSHPERLRQASWKGEQLLRAGRLGFDVPRTLVTTDPERARQFLDRCGGTMIFKVMTDPFLAAERTYHHHPDEQPMDLEARTTVVTQADIDLLEEVRSAPCLFQEYVPKAVEYRVTVIGDRVYAAEIDSQADDRTTVDWRSPQADLDYRAADLPAEVAERCLELVRGYGLTFSAIDLIRTPDDRYVFVENNPAGQFIFVEYKLPELAMTDAVARCLARGSNA